MVSGLAPGRAAVTNKVGKSTLGRSLTGSELICDRAEKGDRDHQQDRRDGPAYEDFGKVQAFASVIALGRNCDMAALPRQTLKSSQIDVNDWCQIQS